MYNGPLHLYYTDTLYSSASVRVAACAKKISSKLFERKPSDQLKPEMMEKSAIFITKHRSSQTDSKQNVYSL